MKSALELVEALGVPGGDSFESVHLGLSELRVGALLELVRGESVPRTGHLGNWDDIAHGRAGALDFNQAICAGGHGYPLIYGFNQTETESGGDTVYQPGSIVEHGRREPLALSTWDGSAFVRRDRSRPLLCPLVRTEHGPLVEVHRRRLARLPWPVRFEAELIVEHRDRVRAMLVSLLEAAGQRDNARSAFADVISHAVSLDGSVARCALEREGTGYRLDGCLFASAEALADHALLLFQAVVEPAALFDRIASLPARLPMVASSVLGRILLAVLAPRAGERNVHLHWGARDMAGFPPRQKGYFAVRSRTRSLRLICDVLVREHAIAPITFALLPAAIFMLCPTTAQPRDAELLAGLFAAVGDAAPDRGQPGAALAERVEAVTHAWLAREGTALSPYLLARFPPRSGVPHGARLPASLPVEPAGFRALTVRQACAIVGALVERSVAVPEAACA